MLKIRNKCWKMHENKQIWRKLLTIRENKSREILTKAAFAKVNPIKIREFFSRESFSHESFSHLTFR